MPIGAFGKALMQGLVTPEEYTAEQLAQLDRFKRENYELRQKLAAVHAVHARLERQLADTRTKKLAGLTIARVTEWLGAALERNEKPPAHYSEKR